MNSSRSHWRGVLLGICAVFAFHGSADASGYAVVEQSVRGLGTAYAGEAAAAEDASTVVYNPAGLARLTGSQVVGGLHVIFPSIRFNNDGSTHVTGQPMTGGEGGNAGSLLLVPNLYYSHELNERIRFGLGLFSPYGLNTEYDSDWIGRYHAVKSDLISLNINPSISYLVMEGLSVGVGVSAQYVKAELSNAIDFGTIFSALGAPGFAPQQNDGFVTLKGDDWSWGYNVGLLYQFNPRTRAGAAYRSSIDHTLKGDADFSGVPPVNPSGRFLDTGAKAEVTTPDTASLSLWHSFSDDLTVVADVTWTNWSVFDELRIEFDNPAEDDAVTTFKWDDTFRYSLGGIYHPEPWAFCIGVAYDESPVPDAAHRTARIPDSDRIWIACGVGYKWTDALLLNLGYAHLFIKGADVRREATGENRLRGGLTGSYDSNVDIVSGELAYSF